MIKFYKQSVIILLSLISNLFFLHQCLTKSVTISDSEKDIKIKIYEIWKDRIDKRKGNNHSKLCPVINNSHIFIANKKGIIKALSLDSGKVIWSVDLSHKFHNTSILLSGGISLSDNKIYIGSEKAIMYALHTKNGAILWKSSVAGEVLSIPIITQDSILLQTENGMLQALNKLDGTINWTIHIDTPFIKIRGTPSPSVICNRAIVGSSNGIVSSIFLNNGKILWQRNLSIYKKDKNYRDITGIQSINHIVYAITYNGILAAINLFSGEIIWYERIEGGDVRDFLVTENAIYLLDRNNRLIAWNIKDRKIIWEQKNFIQEKKITKYLILDANNIFIFDDKGYLYCINVINGILLGKVKLIRTALICSPIIYRDKLIIQSQYGMLHTFLIKR